MNNKALLEQDPEKQAINNKVSQKSGSLTLRTTSPRKTENTLKLDTDGSKGS